MSGEPGADAGVSKVHVKKEIKTIVENLENILGDLKDVAKELKEVVHEIDTLTCDLQLEEEMTDSSKTDTLNSSSSSTTTTASSLEKMKLFPDDFFKPSLSPVALNPAGVLTVFKRARLPPPPPPRHASARPEDHKHLPHPTFLLSGGGSKANGALTRNGVFPLKPHRDLFSSAPGFFSGDGGVPESGLVPSLPRPMPLLRHDKNKCPREPRERVRFSEKVQYHGYCPDCDLQYDVEDTELHLHDPRLSPVHCCSSSSPPRLPRQVALENGGFAHGFPPQAATPPLPGAPPHAAAASPKPQKTILRKSTTTTV